MAQAADRVCNEADMAALLPLLVSKDELATLEQHAEHGALVARARELQP